MHSFKLAVRAATALLGELLSPPACAACDARTPRRVVFCPSCAGTVLRMPRDATGLCEPVIAYAAFGGALAEALRRFKYSNRPDLARPLGDLARHALREARSASDGDLALQRIDVVVPVPMHPRRLASRGYNQAALLARAISQEACAPLSVSVLVRKRETPRQASLDENARATNVAGAFTCRSAEPIRGRRVIVVDDVTTTGATMSACTAALLEAGAISVQSVAVACTLREKARKPARFSAAERSMA